MERYKTIIIIILLLPAVVFSFDPIPKAIYGVNFNVAPVQIPDIVRFRTITSNINRLKGLYEFEFDNGKNEIVKFFSKYNKLYKIIRYIGIYDRINYHFRVREFIRCFEKKYGPAQVENAYSDSTMPEFYVVYDLKWENENTIMRLKTYYYSAMPERKYIPGLNGKDIIIEYVNKKNNNYIYGLDFNLDSSTPCRDVW